MENPFKFGTIVEADYFTDRVNEVAYIEQFIKSANHLVMISPRRYGKSSLVAKAVKESGRKSITLNLQSVTSVSDLSAKLLREFFKVHPMERIRHLIAHFRIVPIVSTNPVTGAMDVSFQSGAQEVVLLEDVLNLLERAHSEKDRLIVVLDEFQEIKDISSGLDRQLRSIMQEQNIFEDKKSPFYHFGELMRLGKLPRQDFYDYLVERLSAVFPESCRVLADRILNFTECHPYYSQQLAAIVWQIGVLQPKSEDVLQAAVDHIVVSHALDYERIWMGFKRTNRWILQRLAGGKSLQDGEYRTSTIYSALKRLQKDGYAVYSDHYELEDPFFRPWILRQG